MRLRSAASAAVLISLSACSTPATTAPQSTPEPSTSAAENSPAAQSETPKATRTFTTKEKAFIRGARKNISEGNADATDEELISFGRDFCGQGDKETVYDGNGGNPPNVEDLARSKGTSMVSSVEKSAVLHLCPKYIKTWKQAMGGFFDGERTVGEDIKPGRYRTLDKGLKGCYWERVSKGGETLANDLVTFAPGYITVTILPTDGGFSSNKECYFWVPADL